MKKLLLLCLLFVSGSMLISPLLAAPSEQALSSTPAAESDEALDPNFMGMVIRDPWYDFGTAPNQPNEPNYDAQDRMGEVMASAGVKWVRLDFHIHEHFSDAEVTKQIAKNDYFINVVAPKHNFKVLGLLSFDLLKGANPRNLNSTSYLTGTNTIYGGGVNAAMDKWLTRSLMIADRYGPAIHAYEVLNEQNRLPSYEPYGLAGDAIKPEITARLMGKFYRFCKNINPSNQGHGCSADTKIILGGLHPRGTTSKVGTKEVVVMTDVEYIEAMYLKNGPFDEFKQTYGYYPIDGIGYHPYPQEIQLSISNNLVDIGMNRMEQVMKKVEDPCKPFWITEVGMNVGFDSDGPRNPIPAITALDQARFMEDVYRSLYARKFNPALECERERVVENIFWFKYEDFPPYESKPYSGIWAQQWGIVRIDFTEGSCEGGACYTVDGKPLFMRDSYYTYRKLAGKEVYSTNLPVVKQEKPSK
jgi:hypothetical protein